MNKIKIIFVTLIAALAFSVQATAQTPAPVRWRAFVKMTGETEGVLTVKALVQDGWHLYGTQLPKGGPVATDINFSASKGIKFVGGFVPDRKPVTEMDASFGIKLNFWTGNVTWKRKFKLTGPKADAVVNGKITFMACSGENCLPPKTQNFTFKIK